MAAVIGGTVYILYNAETFVEQINPKMLNNESY